MRRIGIGFVALLSGAVLAADTPSAVSPPPVLPSGVMAVPMPPKAPDMSALPMAMRPPPADMMASDGKLMKLAREYQAETDATKKDALAEQLREELSRNFVIRQRVRAEHIEYLENEAKRMKELLKKDEEQKDARIEERFRKLIETKPRPASALPAQGGKTDARP